MVQDRSVSDLIANCLSPDKSKRPKLKNIRNVLSSISNAEYCLDFESSHFQDVSREMVEDLILKSVRGLSGPELVDPGKVWHSNYQDKDRVITNRISGVSY